MRRLLPLVFAFFLGSCDNGPKISGQPVDYWISQLDDLDPNAKVEALGKLWLAEPRDLQRAAARLSEIAKGEGELSDGAANLMFSKFERTYPNHTALYYDYVAMSPQAAEAIRAAAIKQPDRVIANLRRTIANNEKNPGKEDLVRESNEILGWIERTRPSWESASH